MNNTEQITLNVSVNLLLEKQLKDAVKLTNKTEEDLIREALEIYLSQINKTPTCYDLALESGIIGVAKDLPSDLSTNPDYFQGFGQL
ncbi:hypothetical protein ACN4EE_07245 [Geminocystis sp. CENA526]|uniref:hypothetical protein n=1 Tax=Geminocystis sp. CENA526 TaxID=1355871 RepID=UPI003D6EE56D